MATLTKTIKARIKSVSNIKKITRAMEMVAASKMRKAIEKALQTYDFWHLSLEILANIASERQIDHPLVTGYKGKKSLVLLISSNKGLCGGYNVNMFKKLKVFLEKEKTNDFDFITIGKYAERFVRKIDKKIIASFVDFTDNVTLNQIIPIKKMIIDEYLKGDYKEVFMAYTHFVSALSSKPQVHQLLPVNPSKLQDIVKELIVTNKEDEKKEILSGTSLARYIFEPNETQVVARVLPGLTEVRIYHAILDSLASEHSSRMMAMKNASQSADEMVADLVLTFNQARQAGITQEISEIAAGAEALI